MKRLFSRGMKMYSHRITIFCIISRNAGLGKKALKSFRSRAVNSKTCQVFKASQVLHKYWVCAFEKNFLLKEFFLFCRL